ncbi:MAG: protein-methionine-sulfoxide reductase heme-binding subunit MsrQ [Methylocystis sp.]
MFAGFSAASKRIPKLAVYAVGFIPAIELLYLGVNDQLGAEPVRALEHGLGLWAMRFLLATLALSPLRQLAGVDLLRFRRQFGLLAFYYVVLHLAAYVAIDMGLDAKALWADIVKRPYVTIGMLGFLLMIPLALTSNNMMIRRMGGHAWARLHRLVYLVAVAGAAHFILVVKSWPLEPIVYAAITALLLGYRAARKWQAPRRGFA